jgi:hypothetical protein
MRPILLGSCFVVLAMGTGCTSADGEVRGGELRPDVDAAAPPPLVAEFPDAPPTTWRGLYRDFFSKNATAGCGQAGCHGTAGQHGALVSGFVCVDVDGCWESLRTAEHPGTRVSLVATSAIADPASAEIFKWIRYLEGSPPRLANNGATMPLQPSDFAFSADAIERMKTWIRNGAVKD